MSPGKPSDLNPNAPPFNNNNNPSTQLALLPLTPTETDGEIIPLPLKPTAAAVDSLQYPTVMPTHNQQQLFYYYYSYYYFPSPPRQPYFPSAASPYYIINNNYHFGGTGPINIYPQPQPSPPPPNYALQSVPATEPPKFLPASVVGGNRFVEIPSGGDGGETTERRKQKIVRGGPQKMKWQRSSLPLARFQYRKVQTSSANKAAGTTTESSPPALISDGGGKTTLMIKNIPNHFLRHTLLLYLDNHCAQQNHAAAATAALTSPDGGNAGDLVPSEYDFFYLPMDFSTKANLGYAFVNFTTAVAASRFEASFQDYQWEAVVPANRKRKVCEVAAATIQGKEKLMKNFMGSRFCCRYDHYLPVYFSPPRDGFNESMPILLGQRVR